MLEDPFGKRCHNCGTQIDQRPWPGAGASITESVPEKTPAEKTEDFVHEATGKARGLFTGAAGKIEGIFARVREAIAGGPAAPAPLEEGLCSAEEASLAQAQLERYKSTTPARQLQADLGVAFARRGQFREAAEAYGRSLVEQGEQPHRFQLLLLLAQAQEAQGSHEEAFRAYLEAVLERPEQAKPLLANAHRLLRPGIALNQGGWVTREWLQRTQSLNLDSSARVHVLLFVARLNLFLDQHERAVELCQEASRHSPALAREQGSLLLRQSALPPGWKERPEGNTRLILARLNQGLGRFKEALAAVNSAIEMGLSDETRYPDAPALRSRGELLEKLGDKREAAKAFLESGQRFQWRSEYNVSEEVLRQGLALDADSAPINWYLANALFMLSEKPDKEERKSRLGEALEKWEAGCRRQQPDDAWSWVYVLGAVVRSNLSEAREEHGRELLEHSWEAVACIERAILLDQAEPIRWAYLGRFYNRLENPSAAIHATGAAMRLKKDDPFVLDARASALANLGAVEAAEPVIESLRQLAPSPWADAVKAFILMSDPARREEALRLIGSAVDAQPEETWHREVRAFGYQLQGQPERARPDYEFLYKKLKMSVPDAAFAWAAYNIDKIPEAIQCYRSKMDRDVGWNSASTLRGLGLCYLVLGDPAQARSCLDAGIEGAINCREIDEFLNAELTDAERKVQSRTGSGELRDLLAWARKKGVERRDQLLPKSGILEGENLARLAAAELQRAAEAQKEESWSWCGAFLGLARLSSEHGKWAEAAEIYQMLLQRQPEKLPEARLGLKKAYDGLVKHGDALLKTGQMELARNQIATAMRFCGDTTAGSRRQHANLQARMGLVHFSAKALPEAASAFSEAFRLYRDEGEASPGNLVGGICRSLLAAPHQYWALDGFLESAGEGAPAEDTFREDFAAMRKALASYLDEFYQLSAQAAKSKPMLPAVTPIAVEIAQDLLPADTGPEWSLFKTYLPQMRDRIDHNFGVRVPGVRVRGDEGYMPAGSYLILLDDVPIVSGYLQSDRRYTPCLPEDLRKMGIPGDAILDAPHPLTGQPGSWIGKAHWEEVIGNGMELWEDPLAFMVFHLEAVLRRNLTEFLGVQEVENLLEAWADDKKDSALVQAALPDPDSRLRFARVLRELVRERVPVTEWRTILAAVRENPLAADDVSEGVQAVRLCLKPQLPGNSPSAEQIELPAALEAKIMAWLHAENGKRYLAIPPEATQEILADIRNLVGGDHRHPTMIVHDSVARPFVRRLVELEWPDLMVLAHAEMLSRAEGGAHHEPGL